MQSKAAPKEVEKAAARTLDQEEASPADSGESDDDVKAVESEPPSAPDWRAYLSPALWEQACIIGMTSRQDILCHAALGPI